MARERPADDGDDDDTLDLTPDMEVDPDDDDESGGDEDDDEGDDEEPGEGDGETPGDNDDEGPDIIGFADDDEPDKGGSSVIRGLRERNRQMARELAEARAAAPAAQQLELPPKPTLADCDYDEDKFEEALTGYHDTLRTIESRKTEQIQQAEEANREWQRDLDGFNTRKAALALPDFDDCATAVSSALNLAQQAVVIKAAGDSAAFIYALGRSDSRLAELAKIKDPIKLAATVARMEGGVKIMKKRKAPAPDRPASGGKPMPGGADKQLEKLEAEAEKTGDRSAIVAYKKRLKARGK